MPSYKDHFLYGFIAFGVAYLIAISYLQWALTSTHLLIGFILTIIASQFPDVDGGNTFAAETAYKLLAIIGLAGLGYWYFFQEEIGIWVTGIVLVLWIVIVQLKHRGITHSLGVVLASSALFYLIEPFYGLSWLMGYASHLLPDSISKYGKHL